MTKTAKIILIIALSPPFIFLGYFFFSGIFSSIPRKDPYLEDKFNFKIDTVFRDKHNRYIVTMKGKNNGEIATTGGRWENIFLTGDSIVKRKDSLKIYLYRNQKLDTILDYNHMYLP